MSPTSARPLHRSMRHGLAAALGVGALALGPLAVPAHAATVDIDLLTMNDFHGRLETSGAVGGAAVLAGAFNEFRAENPNTAIAAAGDLIGASTFTSFIQDDNPTIDALNEAGLQVSSVGNHEYDQGWADLRDDVIGGSDGHPADWPYLAANVVLKSTGEAPAEVQPYNIQEVGGVRIGYVGAVTEELPSLVSPAGIEDLEILPIIDSVNAVAAELSDGDESNGEADVVIMLVHEDAQGAIEDGISDDVDVIVAGHTHETYAYEQKGSGRPIIQTGQYATNVGHINLSFDPDSGDITFNAVENLPLMNDDDGDGVYEPNYTPDPEVEQIVADAVEAAEGPGSVELGTVTQNITRAFDVGVDQYGNPILSEDRGEESTLSNLVADSQRAATVGIPTGEAQIAFMNPGGVRADLCYAEAEYEEGLPVCTGVTDDDGVITYREGNDVQPFANTLVRESLTGAQIKEALEEQLQPAGSSRPFLQLGVSAGFTFTYSMTYDSDGVPTGIDVTSMSLDGVAIDPAASYEVVLNSFLAAGGDNFLAFADAADARDTGLADLQSFVDYMADNSPVSPDLQERAIDASTLGTVSIDWPNALGDPPAMRAGTTKSWTLQTDLPIGLTEDFTFSVEGADGVSIALDNDAAPGIVEGLPEGSQSLPFDLAVDESVEPGDYSLVFTLDRAGDYSVFDGNPIPTPQTITVDLRVSGSNTNPGGPIDTGVSSAAPSGGDSGLLAGLGALALVAAGSLALTAVVRRRRSPVA